MYLPTYLPNIPYTVPKSKYLTSQGLHGLKKKIVNRKIVKQNI